MEDTYLVDIHNGSPVLKLLFRIGLLSLIVLYISDTFLPNGVGILLGIPAIIVLVAGYPSMSKSFRVASAIFLILGTLLFIWSDQTPRELLDAASSMSNIVVIVAVMQTFSIPIRLGEYAEALHHWGEEKLSNRKSLYLFITGVTNILASFLNIGAVPVLVSLLEKTLRKRVGDYEKFFAVSMSRAYILMVLWSPGSINLYLAVQATGVSWLSVFVPGIFLAVLGMGLSCLLEMRRDGVLGISAASSGAPSGPPVEEARVKTGDYGKVVHIPLVALTFVLAVSIMEFTGFASAAQRIVIAGLVISSVWTIGNMRHPGLRSFLGAYWNDGMLSVSQVGPFFVSIGLFSRGLQESGILDALIPTLGTITGTLGSASVVFVAVLIVGLSLIGLHPFISITLFGTMLSRAGLDLSPLTVALGLLVGGAAAYMVSPFGGIIVTIGRLLNVKPGDLAVRWNWRYSLLFLVLGLSVSFGLEFIVASGT